MLRGLIFFEQGGVQQVGELTTLESIIQTIRLVLPDLETKQRERVLASLSDEDLKKLLVERQHAKKQEENK